MTAAPGHGSHYLAFPGLSAKHVFMEMMGAWNRWLVISRDPGRLVMGAAKLPTTHYVVPPAYERAS